MAKEVVNVDNVYQYNVKRDILAKQQWIGTYDLNSTIEASAMPRKFVATNEILSDGPASTVAGVEKGAERGFEKALGAAKNIAPTAKVIGAINDANSLGQHVIQGNGAEATTEFTGIAGQASGAWAGAEAGGAVVGGLYPPAAPAGAFVGGVTGAFIGGKKMKEWGKQLTGGDTPDLMIPPTSPPNNADIQPTITTKDGYQYALVRVEGKYNWYAILDNKDLMLQNRFAGVTSGTKNAELTSTYLKAAGYDRQVQEHINVMIAQAEESTRQINNASFMRAEIAQRNASEATTAYLKQGKAPDGSELGKVKSDGNNASIWIHDSQRKRFVSVATTGHGKDAQSVEMYYDEKTGAHTGGKIYVPDGNGQHKVSRFSVETLPDGSNRFVSRENEPLPSKKVSEHVKNLTMAHAFAHELPINAVKNHGKLAEAYVAQAAFIKQIASSGVSAELKSIALNHFNDKAINNIATGNIPTTQILTSINQVQLTSQP